MAIDAAQCIEQGECMVLTNNMYSMFIGLAILAGLFLIILVLLSLFTPALTFLKAKFKRGFLIYEVNRGQMGRFLICKNKFQGVADVKGVGPFIITENSHTIEQKSKLGFYFAFGEFAATLPLQYGAIIQYLREGNKINNISDLGGLIGQKFDPVKKRWGNDEKKEGSEDKIEKDKQNFNIAIEPFKTIKLHDLAYMFPFNITPALIESRTQHMLGMKMQFFNKLNMQYVLMFIMILMGTTLAAVIAFKFLKTGDTTGVTETRTIIERVVQTVPKTTNLTG